MHAYPNPNSNPLSEPREFSANISNVFQQIKKTQDIHHFANIKQVNNTIQVTVDLVQG